MASKISGQTMYLPITPYKVEGTKDEFNELSVRPSYDNQRAQFYVSLQAGWKSDFAHGSIIDGSNNPLTSFIWIDVENSPRNSQKKLDQMYDRLYQARDILVALFDRREWEKLKNAVINVCRVGYTDDFRKQAEKFINDNKNINNQNSEDETMTNNAKTAQDYVGKVIIVGDNVASIRIISAEGDTMQGEFKKGDAAAIPMPVTMANLQKMLTSGVWKLSGEESRETTTAKDDVEEVEDVKVEPDGSEKAKSGKANGAKKVDIKTEQPKAESKPKVKEPKAEKKTTNVKLSYETYTNKKGKTCARIVGFTEGAMTPQEAMGLHASFSYTKDGNKKVWLLTFGPRYAEAAKDVCDALNAGKSLADAQAIIDATTEERAKKREEWKQKKVYTAKDVAAILDSVIHGADIPEEIAKYMAA